MICYRGYRLRGLPRRRLELPDGVVTVLLQFSGTVRTGSPSAEHGSLVAGLRRTAVLAEHGAHLEGVEIILYPLAAYTIFGLPMHELTDTVVRLTDLLGPRAQRWLDRLVCCPSWESRFALIDRLLVWRLRSGPPHRPEVGFAWRALHRSAGAAPVENLVSELGWSRRRLERWFDQQVGLPPKTLARVLRLQRALRLAESDISWAEVAATAGYHDQPHFDHVFKAMVGCSPSQFRLARRRGRHPRALDRIPHQVTSVEISGIDAFLQAAPAIGRQAAG
ncbi:hypothetical protein GCM10009765_66910 [Fodinicola feengrottensis]|uniref:HTH araC/xylS-type domain-containing protein n=1 Tax=Fodinicola feengrottensis TaxID=435914 RepID=A0ABN2IMJ1_9ACTN